jgi:GMP reductase
MNIIDKKEYLNYSDVLIRPEYSTIASRKDVNIVREFYGHESKHKIIGTPLMITNMDTVGTIKMALSVQELGAIVALHKFIPTADLVKAYTEEKLSLYHFISAGMSDNEYIRLLGIQAQLEKVNLKMPPILLDIANGYSKPFLDYIKEVRKMFPTTFIAAGNIATPEMVEMYTDAGVDAVRIGIGPGGQCRTRETAGVGIPQLTAVMDCAEKAREFGLLVIADGGVNEYADFSKALVAGADFVCAGSMFAGATEAEGKVIWKYPKDSHPVEYKEVYGMSSEKAMMTHYKKVDGYRASEGRTSHVLATGPVQETIRNIYGALRSTMTYVDAKNLEELWEKGTFIKVSDTINRKYEKFTVGI